MDNLITSTKSASDSLRLKLGALFILVFGGLVIGLFAWDIFSAMSAGSEQVVRPEEVTVIDPKLEADLKKVLEFTGLPTDVDMRDPFKDRADLSGVMERITQSNGGAAAPPSGTAGAGTTADGKPPAPPDPVAETKARFEKRVERIRLGLNAGPEAEVFAVDDLLPVGVVGGGSTSQEVLVFSRALKKTLSFPVGTRLFDGWIGEVRSEGVTFVIDGKVRTSRVKLWSIREASGNSSTFERFSERGRGTVVA